MISGADGNQLIYTAEKLTYICRIKKNVFQFSPNFSMSSSSQTKMAYGQEKIGMKMSLILLKSYISQLFLINFLRLRYYFTGHRCLIGSFCIYMPCNSK